MRRNRVLGSVLLLAFVVAVVSGCVYFAGSQDDPDNETGEQRAAIGVQSSQNIVTSPESRLVAGALHTCMILGNGKLKCWGVNDAFQLGVGGPGGRGDEPGEMGNSLPAVPFPAGLSVRSVAPGYQQTCASIGYTRTL